MIQKHQLVNTLFLLGFITYGLGSYMMFMPNFSWTTGLIFGTLPFVAILLFYLLDSSIAGASHRC